jgi:CubicO group peptidase (beta-lactamase class C family)
MAGYDYLDKVPKQAALEMICRQKELNFVPGTKYMYSNSCYFMLALIIERVSGKTMSEFAQAEIFGPLKMDNSRFHDDNTRLIPNRAFSYAWNEDEGRWNDLISRFDLVGSGGIYSTVKDLYQWDQNFYNNQLGPQSMIDTMKTNGVLNDGTSAEYAFAVVNGTYRGLQTMGHGGALAGYRAHFLQFPQEKTSVIILSNYASFGPQERTYEVADIILSDQLGEMEETKTEQNAEEQEEQEFTGQFFLNNEEVVGEYYSEELDVLYRIGLEENNRLSLNVRYNDPIMLEVKGERTLGVGRYIRIEFEDSQVFRVQAGRVQNLRFVKTVE